MALSPYHRAVEMTRAGLTAKGTPKKATDAVLTAFVAAYAKAGDKQRGDLDRCTPESVRACVTTSITTGLYPDASGMTPVYLVPQSSGGIMSLDWRINHRGYSILANRAGWLIMPSPVMPADHLVVSCGQVLEHTSADVAAWPASLDELAGVAVVVQSPTIRYVLWVPIPVILARRAMSRSKGGPWKQWPIPMAMAAAIRFCGSRGGVPIDSPELAAALAHGEAEQDADEDAPAEQPAHRPETAPQRVIEAPRDLPNEVDELTGEGEGERERVIIDATPDAADMPWVD